MEIETKLVTLYMIFKIFFKLTFLLHRARPQLSGIEEEGMTPQPWTSRFVLGKKAVFCIRIPGLNSSGEGVGGGKMIKPLCGNRRQILYAIALALIAMCIK